MMLLHSRSVQLASLCYTRNLSSNYFRLFSMSTALSSLTRRYAVLYSTFCTAVVVLCSRTPHWKGSISCFYGNTDIPVARPTNIGGIAGRRGAHSDCRDVAIATGSGGIGSCVAVRRVHIGQNSSSRGVSLSSRRDSVSEGTGHGDESEKRAWLRLRVLSVYAEIIRLAKTWPVGGHSIDGDVGAVPNGVAGAKVGRQRTREEEETATYIRAEARTLFRKNAHITNLKAIEAHIQEAKSRIDLACHYGNPYPRLVNMPKGTLGYSQFRAAGSGAKSTSTAGTDATADLQSQQPQQKRTQRVLRDAMPSYLRSYTDADERDGERKK